MLAVIGAVLCGVRRVRFGMAMTMVAVAFAALFLLLPEGRLWNVRLLPYYYLSINFMAAIAVAEIGRLLASATRSFGSGRAPSPLHSPPLCSPASSCSSPSVSPCAPCRVVRSTIRVATRGWVCSRPPSVISGRSGLRTISTGTSARAVSRVLADGRDHGRGRSGVRLWPGPVGVPERTPRLVRHADGSDAVAALDRWLHRFDGRSVLRSVGYHPYHFLLQSELSTSPSRAQRDLPYSNLSINQGVGHLQDLGVRYYMAFTDQALMQAQADPRLTEVATAGPWAVFLVADSDLVIGLDRVPVVVDGVQGGERSGSSPPSGGGRPRTFRSSPSRALTSGRAPRWL